MVPTLESLKVIVWEADIQTLKSFLDYNRLIKLYSAILLVNNSRKIENICVGILNSSALPETVRKTQSANAFE